MQFRIADTFTNSLARLSGDEQKAAKTTAFDLQLSPANPGMSFHKLERAKDKHFWSVRVSRDIRLIVHKTASSLLLCFVGHHDKAYQWAECRKLEKHPKTGAAQLVEIRERVERITIPKYVETEQPQPEQAALFADVAADDLLAYGVPQEWLADVQVANEDTLLELAEHLPAEAAEALLTLATGGVPEPPQAVATDADPFEHPDAQRRFRVMSNVEELERALDYPWERWSVFLHPAQRQWVERDYSGPARVSGSAGTGKTVVALHRAVYLARQHPEARVLLTTFSDALATALKLKLRRLLGRAPRLGERIEVHAMDAIGERLYTAQFGPPEITPAEYIQSLLPEYAAVDDGFDFSAHFLAAEWWQVVDAWQLTSWEAYRDVRRLGRKTRLPEAQRAALWRIFERVLTRLRDDGRVTRAQMFAALSANLAERDTPLFDFAVVDEAQDINVAQLGFLAALGGGRANSLFFAGDLGQRIFQLPFSWQSLGVDIRGRSRTLRINYRTSHQIRAQADRLLGPEVADVDGNSEDRRGTVSVFNGASPRVECADSPEQEAETVGVWLRELLDSDIEPHEIAVFVRSEAELERACQAVAIADAECRVLDAHLTPTAGQIAAGTMHLAKGLEFRAVAVMACDDEVIPSQTRIEAIADNADLEEVYDTERHLLYVACTRARDRLLISGVDPASEFVDDLRMPNQKFQL